LATDLAPLAWPDAERQQAFEGWLATLGSFQLVPSTLRLASADASFRRYLRIEGALSSYIVMDAPPPQEDVRPFVHVARLIAQAGLRAPRVLASDTTRGFLLLTDLGSQLYLTALKAAAAQGLPGKADTLMRSAFSALVQWQQRVDASSLPPYDEALFRRELALFPDWCVAREHGVVWSKSQQRQWRGVCDSLVINALTQPTVAVHRDYMPRNLMCSDPGPGILDFQDTARGPITYDAASLLRDAFISWEEDQERRWATDYWEQARCVGLPLDNDFGAFWRQLEWTGLQRHLKVSGIFCRLKHRDGKPVYCTDLPRFFRYVRRVAERYSDFAALLDMLDQLERVAQKSN